jgi:formylmethanofuran dehydrogenase subunit C
LNGNLTSSAGSVALGNNLTLAGTSSITGSTSVTITGNVDGASGLTLGGGAVTVNGAIGGTTPLANLTVNSTTATLNAVTTSGDQAYSANMTLDGNLTSTGGAVTLNTATIGAPVVVMANTINLAGASGAITGSFPLSLEPVTPGTAVTLGAAGAGLNINPAPLTGYAGGLFLGATPLNPATGASAGINTPTAGSITVSGPLTVSPTGSLVLAAGAGGIDLQSGGLLSAGTLILATSGAMTEPTVGVQVQGNTVVLVGNSLGTSGAEIDATALNAPATIQAASSGNQGFVLVGTGLTFIKNGAIADQYANELGLSFNPGLELTSFGEQITANQQTGGKLESGFVDVSVFQQISLYDVNGSGITLPADQCEEQGSTEEGCKAQ